MKKIFTIYKFRDRILTPFWFYKIIINAYRSNAISKNYVYYKYITLKQVFALVNVFHALKYLHVISQYILSMHADIYLYNLQINKCSFPKSKNCLIIFVLFLFWICIIYLCTRENNCSYINCITCIYINNKSPYIPMCVCIICT